MRNDPDFDDDEEEDEDFAHYGAGRNPPRAIVHAPRAQPVLWKPEPLPEPDIDPDLVELPWPERSAEVTRHFVLSTERWLSPSGWLREWVRLNIRVAVAVARALPSSG